MNRGLFIEINPSSCVRYCNEFHIFWTPEFCQFSRCCPVDFPPLKVIDDEQEAS